MASQYAKIRVVPFRGYPFLTKKNGGCGLRYIDSENIIELTVRELASYARRMLSVPTRDEDEPLPSGNGGTATAAYVFSLGDERIRLTASYSEPKHGVLTVRFPSESMGKNPRREEKEQARGEGYLIAKLLKENGAGMPSTLTVQYENIRRGDITEKTETLKADKVDAFFEKCIGTLFHIARAEINRVKVRLPSMARAKFPYPRVREGQNEFIRAAYRAMCRGTELFSEAPTGTGKTVSALFPAIRAIGEGRISKAFYLTPKGTTAKSVADCITLFTESGVAVRSVILSAKDKLCERGRLCATDHDACPTRCGGSVQDAALCLFDKSIPAVGFNDIRRCAKDFGVCPYELALTYSELCDIIVCDLNYLFDPDVYIRRFFTKRGDYAFLIDEAHNLADRAREMYSAELETDDLAAIARHEAVPEHSALRTGALKLESELRAILEPMLKDEIRIGEDGVPFAAYHTRTLPDKLFSVLGEALSCAEREVYDARADRTEGGKARQKIAGDYHRRLKRLYSCAERFDTGYELFVFLSGSSINMKLFCIDTARALSERLALGKSAIFFSGTLTPLDYYKHTLGADSSAEVLNLPSPFAHEQLGVYIMDKISTRISEREDTLAAVCRVIAATLCARRGNYMVFAPSFAYAKSLHSVFERKYPKIRSMLQRANMTASEREEFLAAFGEDDKSYLVGFCVMGGVFAEGIDLTGDKLIGAIVVGIGMPSLSFEREAIAEYYQELLEEGKQYAYIYPGMNRVFQAAGRVIRTEDDRGVVVLIDDRFDDPIYRKTAPTLWRGVMKFLPDAHALKSALEKFWAE